MRKGFAMTDEGQASTELENIAFIGATLAPFFLEDPRTGNAGAAFAALGALDVKEAAPEWPFVVPDEAERDLGLMVRGLASSGAAGAGAHAAGAGDRGGADADAEEPDFDQMAAAFHADDDLMWEYRRLFVGPAEKPAPPWGSVYTDRECVVFGASTLDLRAWMREHGIARTTDEKTPEDHIGLMLALMAWIAANQPADLDEYLRLHLLTWSSHYLDELAEAAEHPFYEGLARLTKASLEGIQAARRIDVEYPRFYR